MPHPQHSVLFRYFFFQWMFQDVNAKEVFQRAAAVRHNQAQRPYLLVYFRRWAFLTVFAFAVGALLEHWGTTACALFYTGSAISSCTLSKIGAAWLLMGRS